MVLSETVISLINTKAIRRDLLIALDVTEQSVINYINKNKSNGPLTTASALNVIKKHTGLSDSEILTDAFINANVKV